MSEPKKKQFNFKCDDAFFLKVTELASTIDRTAPDFIRMCVEACVEMASEEHQAWFVPQVIHDILDRKKRRRLLLADSQKLSPPPIAFQEAEKNKLPTSNQNTPAGKARKRSA